MVFNDRERVLIGIPAIVVFLDGRLCILPLGDFLLLCLVRLLVSRHPFRKSVGILPLQYGGKEHSNDEKSRRWHKSGDPASSAG